MIEVEVVEANGARGPWRRKSASTTQARVG